MADPSNTARNFILTGLLLGVGAAGAGVYIMNNAELPDLQTSIRGSSEAKIFESLTKAPIALTQAAKAERLLADVAPQGAIIPRVSAENGSEPRYTPLFFAPKLWSVTSARGGREMRDLMSPKSKDLHESVKNTEFFKYGIESIIGRADALDLDSDGDGFTNREEFASKTNPNDKASMPPFLLDGRVKLLWKKRSDPKHAISLGPNYSFNDEIVLNVYNVQGANATRYDKWELKEDGETFGFGRTDEQGALAKNRFKLVGRGKDDGGKFLEIEDTYAIAEADKRFKLYPGEKKRRDVQDVTVTFLLTAGPEKGNDVKDVRLGSSFAVPGFPGVTCTLTKATDKNTIITIGDDAQAIKLDKWISPAKDKPEKTEKPKKKK